VRRWLLLGATAALVAASPTGGAPAALGSGTRLAVLIVVDQMRADYLRRFAPFFGEAGFRRLTREGRVFSHARYSHLTTFTGPGHALIGSGLYGDRSGIVGNRWYSRALGRDVNCAVGPLDPSGAGKCRAEEIAGAAAGSSAGNPCNALGKSLAERVKERYPAARVIGVGLKDRSAILPPGKGADAAYWVEEGKDGPILTCSLYYPSCNDEVLAFNHEMSPNTFFGGHPERQEWSCSLPPPCEKSCPEDVPTAHEDSSGLGRSFPHPVRDVGVALSTPSGDELLESLAERVVEAHDLGHNRAGQPDVLSIGFSSTDYFGHLFGPDSCEVADGYKRLDQTLARLLTFLEKRVGKDALFLILTADHGVTPLPEVSLKRGIPAGRIELGESTRRAVGRIGDLSPLRQRMEFELARHLGVREDASTPLTRTLILGYREPSLYLNHEALDDRQVRSASSFLKSYLLHVEGIGGVYTSREIERGKAPESVRLSWRADRCGDLVIILEPGWIEMGGTGTTHGQPYEDDAWVPLLVWGAGIEPGVVSTTVDMARLAPTLAAKLGLEGAGFSRPEPLPLSPQR